ncbi:MAG: bifunctional pyr operon transcriptional regulator/uracil phosphoribosyltransferase PyrR [Vampirovibrionales bacterium]|nr:bifunctional pyr operon transcriptional regulator/uracil phosphoribosyltransferase PyrR [Vampirovibrionales bacterium]
MPQNMIPDSLQETVILSSDDVARTLKRLTHELLEKNNGSKDLVLMGILTRGKPLAERIGQLVEQFEGNAIPVGYLDITLYRDDTGQTFKPTGDSLVPVDITDKRVILVDDVLFSGRSIRAALDAINAYGRPASVQLMVLLDRGHRDLPIRADYVGKNLPTAKEERVFVRLKEVDGDDQVVLRKA